MYKQIVVTGIGVVSPLGTGVTHSWKRLMNGESGIVDLRRLYPDYKDRIKSQIAGLVPIGDAEGSFNENDGLISTTDLKRMGKYQKYAIHATNEALKDAGWTDLSEEQKGYTGVSIGNGLGALDALENKASIINKLEPDAKVLSSYGPFFIPSVLPSLAAGSVSIQFGFRGPNRSVNTACASGLYSIEDGASMIRLGDSKVVVAGSTESTICLFALGGFDAMTALCRNYNDAPEKGSRPYDKNRCGFVLAEGCGILILEEMEHAIARGAKIYAEYMGCGMTADAYHISAPSGKGSEDAMRIALRKANLDADKIGYIGTHATSTGVGDKVEIESMRRVFGENLKNIKFSGIKSSIGHSLAAASGVETVYLIKSLEEQLVPPTINVDDPDDFVEGLDYVPNSHTKHTFEYAMKNSFGFGGTNASSIFKKWVA